MRVCITFSFYLHLFAGGGACSTHGVQFTNAAECASARPPGKSSAALPHLQMRCRFYSASERSKKTSIEFHWDLLTPSFRLRHLALAINQELVGAEAAFRRFATAHVALRKGVRNYGTKVKFRGGCFKKDNKIFKLL